MHLLPSGFGPLLQRRINTTNDRMSRSTNLQCQGNSEIMPLSVPCTETLNHLPSNVLAKLSNHAHHFEPMLQDIACSVPVKHIEEDITPKRRVHIYRWEITKCAGFTGVQPEEGFSTSSMVMTVPGGGCSLVALLTQNTEWVIFIL